MVVPDEEYLEAMRAGVRLANARGVTAVHDKDGWLGALRLWQQLERARVADAARLAVDPARARSTTPSRLGLRSGFGSAARQARLPEGVHGRDARLADGVDARRQRRADHERRGARRDRAARRRGRLPGRGPRDRRPREPRSARRVRADARRSGRRSACASGSSTRSCSRPRTCRVSPQLGVAVLGAVLARAVRPRPGRSLLGGQDGRRLRVPLAARLGRRRRERQRCADRGARPARRASAPACAARSTSAPPGIRSRR